MSRPALSATLSNLLHHLRVAADVRSLRLAVQTHALAFPLGLQHHLLLATRLVSAYSLLGLPTLSRLVFDSSEPAEDGALRSNVFLWNYILSAYSRNSHFQEPLALFRAMLVHVRPDNFTLAIVSKAAGEVGDLRAGRMVHCLVTRVGFGLDSVVLNSVMGMYFACGEPEDACRVFDEMPVRTVASWNKLISERASSGDVSIREEAWRLVARMQMEGFRPNSYTVSSVLSLCCLESRQDFLLRGREIHGFVVKNDLGLGLELDFHIGSCLINMYCKSNDVATGRRVFDLMVPRNVVMWTAMVTGYVQMGEFEEAFSLFRRMQIKDRIRPNKVTLLSILSAVRSAASYMQVREVHGFAIRAGLMGEVSLNNSLIDMYFKCGSLECAKGVFYLGSWEKDSISWTSMICGLGLHGRGEDAIALFHEMCRLGIKLNHITCMGVISACSRSGLIAEGIGTYRSLVEEYHFIPTAEICSCMVDMFCRAGLLSQALDFIYSMPVEASPSVWGALFSSAVTEGNHEMQDLAYGFLLNSEPGNTSNYVTLSNSHASTGRWDIVAEIRRRIKKRGLQKYPGCSWISVSSIVHTFFVADKSHQCSDKIYEILDNLLSAMKEPELVPDAEYRM